jgi:protein O-mannosyl-transferase
MKTKKRDTRKNSMAAAPVAAQPRAPRTESPASDGKAPSSPDVRAASVPTRPARVGARRARSTSANGASDVRGAINWLYIAGALAAIALAFWAYAPSLHGAFLFDDTVLPFALPGASAPLWVWLRGVRPILMFTYWINSRISADDTYWYHVFNVLIHCFATGMIFLLARKFLEWSGVEEGKRDWLAAFAALVFLLHPVEAEAVAYLAGRSEALSVSLVFAAFAVFVYRSKTAVTWLTAAAILALFGAALLAKEHTIVLPALLLLTDYWWNPGFSTEGIRRNWRLYLPLALGAVGGVAMFWNLITSAGSAGFGLKDFTWYQYFFTQCRAIFVYLGMFVLPVNLTADWDFPISRTILDHGAIVGLAALCALSVAAWCYRRRFPLATYGWFLFLLLMAPTSSFLPIRDAIAERRMYLSTLGLLLILVDALSRLKMDRKVMAPAGLAVLLLAAGVTRSRAAVWSDPVSLWQDTVSKSPAKSRAHFQLASAYYDQKRCDLAVSEYQKTSQLMNTGNTLDPQTYNLLVDWALGYDCLNQPEEALAKLRQAAALEPTAHVYSQIGMVYAKQQRWAEALDALDTAEKIDPTWAVTYDYRGGVRLLTNQAQAAVEDYKHALALNPDLEEARRGLAQAQARLNAGR